MGVICESSLASLYQYYNSMKFYGKYSTFEVDEMLPFERDIYRGLLLKTIEENKSQLYYANEDKLSKIKVKLK